MRLTIINQFYTPDLSPTAHLCASLAEHRAAMGDQVTVITGRGGYLGKLAGAHDDCAVDVRRVWTSELGSRSVARRFADWATFYLSATWETLSLPPQDVIIALTTPPFIAWAGLLHKWMHRHARLVLWNMDCWPDTAERLKMIRQNGLLSRAMRWGNRVLLRNVDELICLDDAMANLVLSQYATPGKTPGCTIIPNWESAIDFPKTERPGRGDNLVFVILYLGNAGYGHDFQTMLDAASLLRDEPVRFRFVGGGSQYAWIAHKAAEHGLTNISLNPYVAKEQTPGVMQQADCALITLENYALGVMSPSKLHANLACGLPILYVGPEGSNVDRAIKDFDCGFSIRPGNSAMLADAIKSLRMDRQRLATMRRNSRQAFETSFCDTQALAKYDQVLDRLN